jgi:hypothetical protein
MSEAFRCDGCDEFYGGRPTDISICLNRPYTSDTVTLGHDAGRDDGHPKGEEPTHKVEWPFSGYSVELCAKCTAEYLMPGIQQAAQQGRYAREKSDDE